MTPEQAIYDRIKTVTPNVSPTQPDANIDLPQLVYTVTSSEPQRTLSGSGSLTKHSVQIESYAETSADANALLAGVRAVLDGYAGGNIHRAFWSGQDTQPEDDAYHGTATYTVWMTTTNIVPTVGANTIITTGNNFIELEACDHVLRLDCDGLTLDNAAVGGGGSGLPSQSGQSGEYLKTNGTTATWEPLDIPTEFARKDTANTFTEEQNFGTIEVDQINGGAADFTGSVEAAGGFIKGGVEITNFNTSANHTFSGNNSFTGGNDFQGQVAFTDTTTFLGPVNAGNITATGSIDAETSLSTNGGLSCGSLTCYGNGSFSGSLTSDDGLSTSEVNAASVVTPDVHFGGALAVSALGPNGTTGVYSDPTENAEKVTVNVADIPVVEITGKGITAPGFFKGGIEIKPYESVQTMTVLPANTTTAPNVLGGVLTTNGTISHPTQTYTGYWVSRRRTRWAAALTAGALAGIRTSYGFAARTADFGFRFVCRFGRQFINTSEQCFIGLSVSAAALAGEPSALLNMIGVGFDSTDTAWQVMRNDGSGTATKSDSFTRNATDGYQLEISVPANSAVFTVKVTNLNTSTVHVNTTFNTDVPAVNTLLAVRLELRNAGVTTTASTIELERMYVEY